MPSNPSGLAAPLPSSPLRSVSLGPQPTSLGANAQSLVNSGAATPPRKPIPLASSGTPPPASGTTTPGKTRARDLLRKHYGLGVGPPPTRATSNPSDPMDLSECVMLIVVVLGGW
jgi:hypothetical protein